MKIPKIHLLFLLTVFAIKINAQVSFTLSTSLCAGNTATVVANTGTLSAIAYSWAASPAGPVFSASSSATTTINFPSAGTFTVAVGVLTGTGYSYATNTIVINPSPTLVINASSSTICAGQSVTLTATGSASYTWSPGISLNTTSGSSVIATPGISTQYNVTGILGSCTASVSKPIIVNPSPSPGSLTITSSAQGGVCAGFTATLIALGASNYTWTGSNITTQVNQQSLTVTPGSYTVNGLSGGCLLTNSTTVALSPPINIIVTQSSPTTCINSNFPQFSKPVHLVASGASSYAWFPYTSSQSSSNIQDVRPVTNMCYTVVGTTPSCSNIAVSCIIVVPQFSITVSPATATICLSQSVTLGVANVGTLAAGPSTAFNYNWAEALNAPPISISSYFTPTVSVYPQNSTTYTVEVQDAVGCISYPELIAVSVMTCTGIEANLSGGANFQVYPNPANDKLFIRSDGLGIATLQIMNISGKVIVQQNVSFNRISDYSIDLSTIECGIYFLKIDAQGESSRIMKIVKE